jgi:hypothetical protein
MPQLSQSDLEHESLLQQLDLAREAIEAHKHKVNSIVILIGTTTHIETMSAGSAKDTINTIFAGGPALITELLQRNT